MAGFILARPPVGSVPRQSLGRHDYVCTERNSRRPMGVAIPPGTRQALDPWARTTDQEVEELPGGPGSGRSTLLAPRRRLREATPLRILVKPPKLTRGRLQLVWAG